MRNDQSRYPAIDAQPVAGMKATTRFRITGKVQGVFFRASTREQAQRFGLSGYARNLHDGRVEVLAFGAADAIEALASWLSHGPPSARVAHVEREIIDADSPAAGFSIA